MKVKSLSRARVFVTPWIVACTKLLCPWDFQGKSTGVGCHFLLQGIFPTQGLNPGFSHSRQTLYPLSYTNCIVKLITLQYCSGFRQTVTWISHRCTCVPYPEPPPTSLPTPFPRVIPVHQPWAPCLMHQTWVSCVTSSCFTRREAPEVVGNYKTKCIG